MSSRHRLVIGAAARMPVKLARLKASRLGASVWITGLAAAVPMSAASAADVTSRPAAPSMSNAATAREPDWTIDIGAFGLFSPKFFGSKDSKFSPIPYVSIKYKDIAFASIDKGVGVNILSANGFTMGAFVGFRGGRDVKDSRRYLTGLGDVDPTVTAGAFVKYEYARYFVTELKIDKGIVSLGDDKQKLNALGILEKSEGNLGTRIDWSADLRIPLLDNRLFLSVGPRVSFFDKEYAESAYGITANQSLASGYRAFKPKGGIGEVGVGGSARYRITENIYASAFGGYTRIVGDAAKSPLVTGPGGSKDQFKAGIGLTYRFGL
jgi:outer membrane scaffolding protein for murein synthesis (MipA/OmpV family)